MSNYVIDNRNVQVSEDLTIKDTMTELDTILTEINETINAITRAIYIGNDPIEEMAMLTNKDGNIPPLRDMCRDHLETSKRILKNVQELRKVLW